MLENYDFWLNQGQLAVNRLSDANAKKKIKLKELQDFIRPRF